MLFGYARAIQREDFPSIAYQKEALIAYGVESSHIYIDVDIDYFTYIKNNRIPPSLRVCLKTLRAGDILVFYPLSNLTFSVKKLVSFISSLFKAKIGLKVLSGSGEIFDSAAFGEDLIMLGLGIVNEYQNALQSERTKAGLRAARSQGRVGGRRPSLSEAQIFMAQAAAMDRLRPMGHVYKALGISPGTFWRYVGPNGELRTPGERVLAKSADVSQRRPSRRTSVPPHAK